MQTTNTKSHVYHTALQQVSEWSQSQQQILKDYNITYEYLNVEQYPNQPDTNFYGSYEALTYFINTLYYDDVDQVIYEVNKYLKPL